MDDLDISYRQKTKNIIISSCDAERDGDRSAVASDAEGYLIDDEEVD